MELVKIKEGETELFVYKGEKISSDLPVFYNPNMKINRNLTVCAVSVFKDSYRASMKFCDSLAASGAMGLRVAKEALTESDEVILNDKNPKAVELIKRNVELNSLKNCRVENKDANFLLNQEIFTVVDIDPFGTPAPFLDSCAKGVFWKGMLFITATDTAPLCGTYPQTCLRKYGITSFRSDFSKELGIRILISSIIKACAVHEKAFIPFLSLSKRHFFRVMGKIERGKGRINRLFKNFDYISYCQKCAKVYKGIEKKCECGNETNITGSIYLGNLWNKKFIEQLVEESRKRKFTEEEKLLNIIYRECEIEQYFYFNTHALAERLKKSPPKIAKLIELLKSSGYKASKTHFSEVGIRTNAPLEEFVKFLK